MKVVILNGNSSLDNDVFDIYISKLNNKLLEKNDVKLLNLKEMDIKYCTGCFGCWVKKPGQCVANDDSIEISKEIINSDLVIFASPIQLGLTSALLKKALDKLVQLILPYFKFVNGEVHHKPRYDKYPKIGLLLQKEDITDDEDIDIIKSIYERVAINFHSKLEFIKFINDDIEVITNEITSN